jgi:hypothetical protein
MAHDPKAPVDFRDWAKVLAGSALSRQMPYRRATTSYA